MKNTGQHNIRKSKIAGNTIALFSASVLDKIFFFLIMLYFTRYMGPSIYGEYLLVMALLMIFRMLVNFGLNRLLVRDLARDFSRIEDYLGNSVIISIGFSVFYYIVLLTTVKILKYPDEIVLLVSIAGISLLPFSCFFRYCPGAPWITSLVYLY